MPHRVATFFRSHSSSNSSDLHPNVDKKVRRPSNTTTTTSRPNLSLRSPSTSTASVSSEERGRSRMPDNSHKRLSLTTGMAAITHHGHHSPRSSQKSIVHIPATLDCLIESPPLVFYGPTNSSTGALLSGQLRLHVSDDHLAIDSFKMRLAVEVRRKRPFHTHCQECSSQDTDLTTWNFLAGPATLQRGEHSYPFSFLLPGNLPATMKGSLSSIDYVLKATITPKSGEPIKLSQPLNIKRAVYPAEAPRHSIRIFPPTNLTASCELPPVIYPIGQFNITMRLDGVVKRNPDIKTQNQWRLKRVIWRLEETQKSISPACTKHAAKLGAEIDKGVAHSDIRVIGQDELKTGWKSDYTTPDGSIDLEFPFAVSPTAQPVCDMKAEDGTEVTHLLVVEMIVAEEFAPLRRPAQVAPTGAARVLRMHFNVVLTERSGLGISWDEEQPPLYENVPASPPAYGKTEVYESEDAIPGYELLPPLDYRTPSPSPPPAPREDD